MKHTLIRLVNKNTRIYSLELSKNLLGEWMVVRTFSSYERRHKARSLFYPYKGYEQALEAFQKLIALKLKKGYECIVHSKMC
jgi:hypothetical protein